MRLRLIALLLPLALGPLAAPPPVEAQGAGKVYRIGVLTPVDFRLGWDASGRCRKDFAHTLQGGVCEGLREQGYLDYYLDYLPRGNLRTLYAYEYEEEEALERLPQMAAKLIRAEVDLILAVSTPAALAAKKATRTIPIVFVGVGDPVAAGLVVSLARPGGNVTGVTNVLPELAGKQLELLKEAIPRMSRVAVLWNPSDQASMRGFKRAQVAARGLGLTLHSHPALGFDDFERAFAALSPERADGLLIIPASTWVLGTSIMWIVDPLMQTQLPVMFWRRLYVEAGALMAYGPNFPRLGRRVADLVAKILKGANPADLPVEQPTQFELAINLKTAKALGLTIPPSLLFRADRVIK